jgi:hypothetical protein
MTRHPRPPFHPFDRYRRRQRRLLQGIVTVAGLLVLTIGFFVAVN